MALSSEKKADLEAALFELNSIARELSRYALRTILIEARSDLGDDALGIGHAAPVRLAVG